MNIIVDADACPSINLITEFAKNNKINLILYTDDTHNLVNEYATIKVLSKGYQSVDMAIANEIKKNDILITQDFGLATLALTHSAYAVHPKGMIYNNNNIEQLLFERYLNNKSRKQNIHIKGPKKRKEEDNTNLINSLKKCLNI